LRIKSHTTKNIINNLLLLCQRGVNGVRPLLQPTLLQRGIECFQNAVQPITAFSGKKKQTVCREDITEHAGEHSPLVPSRTLVPRDKNVFLRPPNPDFNTTVQNEFTYTHGLLIQIGRASCRAR